MDTKPLFPICVSCLVALLRACLTVVPTGPAVAQSAPPGIARHPRDVSRSLGDTARLGIAYTSETPAIVQWLKDGVPLPGRTNSLLVVSNLVVGHTGSYSVQVSNAAGTVTSDPARVEVDTTFVAITDTPVSRDAGRSMAWGDYDGDGRLDVFLASVTGSLRERANEVRFIHRLPILLRLDENASFPCQRLLKSLTPVRTSVRTLQG